jgi:hypothetical protein
MSKREAEEALRDIRYGMYGDEDEQIHPTIVIDSYGHKEKRWPEQRFIIWAYFHDDYSRLAVEDEYPEPKEVKELEPVREYLRSKDGETIKVYNKRFANENPYGYMIFSPTYHRVEFNDRDEISSFLKFIDDYNIYIKDDDRDRAEYGYSSSILLYCDGLKMVQILDTAIKEKLKFEFNGKSYPE